MRRHPRTLRYYEYLELLKPTLQGRERSYDRKQIARFKLILRGRRFGMKLEDIRVWLEIYKNRGSRAQLSRCPLIGSASLCVAQLS
ncbi:MerR family transcriptional regulator [Sulfitobacter profundi]|uniref:MerR family transcriptional regulator n=1 Tax=Sulfitobacter profundi TaxID=2679961 RepID=A0ABW1Z4Q3_9RHOB